MLPNGFLRLKKTCVRIAPRPTKFISNIQLPSMHEQFPAQTAILSMNIERIYHPCKDFFSRSCDFDGKQGEISIQHTFQVTGRCKHLLFESTPSSQHAMLFMQEINRTMHWMCYQNKKMHGKLKKKKLVART